MPDDQCSACKSRGRPVVLAPGERRERVFNALDTVFRRDGMQGLTMDAVASEAGMSKRTLYGLFGDRDALLGTYVERVRSAFVHPLSDAARKLPLRDRLHRLLEPDLRAPALGLPVAVLRLSVATAESQPSIALSCLKNWLLADRTLICAELDEAVIRGEAVLSDTQGAAAMLQSMIHLPIVDLLLDTETRPTDSDIRDRFEMGLSIFLRGVDACK